MALSPVPLVATAGGAESAAPEGAIPVALFQDPPAPAPLNPVLAALIAAGFGSAGEVLATNSTGDGFEWVTPNSEA